MHQKQRNRVAISDAALSAFAVGDSEALHSALRLSPWTPSPLNVDSPHPPAWVAPRGSWAKEWEKAWQLRAQLQDAA